MSAFCIDLGPEGDVKQPTEDMTSDERMAFIQANIALEHIHVITNKDECRNQLQKWHADKQQATLLCLIDTGSARTVQKIFIKNLKTLVPADVTPRVAVLAGPMMSGAVAAEHELDNEFPRLGCFATKLTSESSTKDPMSGAKRKKTQVYSVNEWCVVAKSQAAVTEQFGVPYVMDKFPSKLRKLDKSIHVCSGKDCNFFKGKSGVLADPQAQIHVPAAADTEDTQFSEMMSNLLEDAGADLFDIQQAQPAAGPRPIWTFMRSTPFYGKLLKDLLQMTTASAVLVVSSTTTTTTTTTTAATTTTTRTTSNLPI